MIEDFKHPPRLTDMAALELALYVAQYFYYARDTPIMTDSDYDQLEAYYKTELKKAKGRYGMIKGLTDKVGSGENLKDWLFNFWSNR